MKRIYLYFKNNTHALISWCLLLIWMIVIFIFSAQNAVESSDTSGSILTLILRITYRGFKQMDSTEQFVILEAYQHVIRKLAHFLIFGILGVLAVNAYKSLKTLHNMHVALLSLATCLIYAILDEIHQIFVPGRSCEIMDIIIDSSGSFIFIAISVFVIFVIENKKSSLSEKP